jgi:hypothetical protein
MKTARIQILVGFFLTVAVIVTFKVFTTPRPAPVLTNAETSLQLKRYALKEQHLERDDALTVAAYAGLLSSACLAVIILASGWHRAHVKRAKVHTYKIDQNEIIVHERDLSMAWQICTGLVNAQALERSNAGMHKAFELYTTMADIQNAQLRALVGRRGLPHAALPASSITNTPALVLPDRVPTMRELLDSGDIAPGKPLIIGILPTGDPLRSQVEENYSTVVIGASGSGKTSGEAFNVSSTILACGARYTILDPHYPDKKKESLGDRLGDLLHSGYITIYNNPLLLDEIIEQLDRDFEAYKHTGQGHTPHIIVVDEHKTWMSSSTGGQALLTFEEKIIFEGRKYEWYLHVTSKSALAQDFGSSAIRDNFVTSLLYRNKKHQAQTFFKDADQVALLNACRKEGQAVYTNRQGHSHLIQVPFCTADDMQSVAKLIVNGGNVARSGNALATPFSPLATGTATHSGNVANIVADIRTMLQSPELSTSQIARDAGIDKGHLSKILNGKRELTPEMEQKLLRWKQRHASNVVQFPTKSH